MSVRRTSEVSSIAFCTTTSRCRVIVDFANYIGISANTSVLRVMGEGRGVPSARCTFTLFVVAMPTPTWRDRGLVVSILDEGLPPSAVVIIDLYDPVPIETHFKQMCYSVIFLDCCDIIR